MTVRFDRGPSRLIAAVVALLLECSSPAHSAPPPVSSQAPGSAKSAGGALPQPSPKSNGSPPPAGTKPANPGKGAAPPKGVGEAKGPGDVKSSSDAKPQRNPSPGSDAKPATDAKAADAKPAVPDREAGASTAGAASEGRGAGATDANAVTNAVGGTKGSSGAANAGESRSDGGSGGGGGGAVGGRRETSRYIIYQSETLVVWLIWYVEEKAPASEERLRRLGLEDVIKYLADQEGQEKVGSILNGLGPVSDDQLLGLGHACRAYHGDEDTTHSLEELLLQPKPYRNQILALLGELGRRAKIGKGLGKAIDRGLVAKNEAARMGLIGQLRAANEFARRHPPRTGQDLKVDFEVPRDGREGFREVDLRFTAGDKVVDVEVKTSVADKPAIDEEQIRKDLLAHLDDRWENLAYLYPAGPRDNLDGVRKAFLSVFDGVAADAAARKIPDPFKAAGTTSQQARAALEARLPSLVSTFDAKELKVERRR